MRMTVLCNVILCTLVDRYQQLGSRLLKNGGTLSIKLHGITSQKRVIFMSIEPHISNIKRRFMKLCHEVVMYGTWQLVWTHAAIIKSITLHVITMQSHKQILNYSTASQPLDLQPGTKYHCLFPRMKSTVKGTRNARGQMQPSFGLNHKHCNHCAQPGGGNF